MDPHFLPPSARCRRGKGGGQAMVEARGDSLGSALGHHTRGREDVSNAIGFDSSLTLCSSSWTNLARVIASSSMWPRPASQQRAHPWWPPRRYVFGPLFRRSDPESLAVHMASPPSHLWLSFLNRRVFRASLGVFFIEIFRNFITQLFILFFSKSGKSCLQ
jgi:hypothetical protein